MRERYKKFFETYWSVDHLLSVGLNTDSGTLQRFLNELKTYKKEIDNRIKEIEEVLKEQKEFEKNLK